MLISPLCRCSSKPQRKIANDYWNMFPVANLREVFESKGTKKEEICYAAAASNDVAQIKRVAEFVDKSISVAVSQHVICVLA